MLKFLKINKVALKLNAFYAKAVIVFDFRKKMAQYDRDNKVFICFQLYALWLELRESPLKKCKFTCGKICFYKKLLSNYVDILN